MNASPLAGGPADRSMLVDVPRLITAYYAQVPDPAVPAQRVAFGTSGHRGSALDQVIDLDGVRGSDVTLGVDPLGGAGVHYWEPIAQRYGLNLTVVSDEVDPTFGFMTVDGDGQIRMDPSSPYAMRKLIGLKDRFQIAFACDTDHDRHGIVTRDQGLLPPNHSNHYLAVAISYLFQHRPRATALPLAV